MRSTAQGASTLSSQPANEQGAIVAGVVKEPEQESQPPSNTSSNSTTTESKSESSTNESLDTNAISAVNDDGSASQSKAVSGERETTSPNSQASANVGIDIEVTTSTANSSANDGNGESSTIDSTQDDDDANTEGSFQDEAFVDKDSESLAPTLLPKNDLAKATQLEVSAFERSGSLTQDGADLYQFTVEETGIFTATLTNLSADADVQLIQDKNDNGQVDAGEIVAWEWEHGSKDESIRHFLQEGDYVLRVLDQDISPEPTNYSVTTTFQAAETDDRAFSINVVYQRSIGQLNEQAREAIERAADYWENVISHSSFDRPLELALGIYGIASTQSSFLAYAGPYSYREIGEAGNETLEDRLLPVSGFAVLNNFYLDEYNTNPSYLESVLRHEIGHALGLGVMWDSQGNDLLDPDIGVYRAETYAGQSYGELLGTGVATEIPLDQNSLTHWDEGTFDTELMTPKAEGIGEPLPLSQLTISSLRDLGWNVNYGAAEAFSLDSTAIA